MPIMLDQVVETAKKDLKKIKKKEQKLNTSNQQHIQIIQQTQERRNQLVAELKTLAISNQENMIKVDSIEQKLHHFDEQYQSKMEEMQGNNRN